VCVCVCVCVWEGVVLGSDGRSGMIVEVRNEGEGGRFVCKVETNVRLKVAKVSRGR
jgi:hypothetical protein